MIGIDSASRITPPRPLSTREFPLVQQSYDGGLDMTPTDMLLPTNVSVRRYRPFTLSDPTNRGPPSPTVRLVPNTPSFQTKA